jgi:hypothetical protein
VKNRVSSAASRLILNARSEKTHTQQTWLGLLLQVERCHETQDRTGKMMNISRIPSKDSYELEGNSIGFLECSASRRHRSECAVTRAETDAFGQNG